ncbi:MAG: M1 family metallopeptidase, partial [Rhodospirillaceae bacterium]|nr:M1 family metallopeptidase [Rhodospirillaceae bacterium]
YEKGGGVLSMFERYYGEETFRRGVTHYLEKFRWGVATSKDFFQSIAEVAGDERGLAAFQSFINQPGVPTVKADLRCGRSGARLRLSQSRYLVKPEAPHIDQRWQIPVCVASAGDGGQRQSTCALMTDRTMDVDLPGGACPAWVMPNADGAGYFRFSLDLDGWRSLIGNAEHLNAAELLSLLDSLDAAFTAGAIDTEVYADGVQAVMAAHPQGTAWDVLAAPLARLAWIEETLVADRAQAGVKAYTDQLYGPQFDAFGLDPTSARDRANPTTATLARTPLVNVMLNQVGRTDVSDELARRGSAFLGLSTGGAIDAAAVDANLLEPALTAAVRAHGTAAADLVERHLKTERNAIYRSRMLTALTRSTDPAVAARARALALSDDLRVNEVPIAVYGAVREAENIDAGWQWFKDNFDAIAARTPPNNRGELAEIGSRFCTKARREDYRRFFAPRIEALTGAPRTMAMVLERIDACILLVDQQRRKATKHFSTFQDGQS